MTDRSTVEQASAEPLLSIVVPIHNVAAYLDECLKSLADQDIDDIEVIMVDDGSTDRSGEIAANWAARDDRYLLIRQQNHGLGHARNTGAEHVRGRYMAFLDSDDRVGRDSYRRMIDSLEESGSDFAIGNVHRFDSSGRTWQASRYRNLAKMDRAATHVSQERELLRDHLAHNKVWRTSFWRDSELSFPVGVLYEDIPTTIPAHVKAKSVDIVPVVAEYWRLRDQGDQSITQNRHKEARHLRDRLAGMLAASRYIGEHSTQDVKDDYDVLVLSRDLRMHIDLYPEVDETYRTAMFSAIGQFLEQVSDDARRRTPVAIRIAYALLEQGAREDFAEWIRLRRADRVSDLPVSVKNGRAIINLDLPNQTTLAADIRDITSELEVVSQVSDFEVAGRNLVISGWAYIAQLPIEHPHEHEINVWLEGASGTVGAKVTYRRDERAAANAGAAEEASGRVAFTAQVPLRKLQTMWRGRTSLWTVMVSVTNSGITGESPLSRPLVGKAERPLMVPLRRGRWLRVCWADEGLTCRVRPEAAMLAGVRAEDGALELAIKTKAPVRPDTRLRVRSVGSKDVNEYPVLRDRQEDKLGHCRLPAADLPGLGGAALDAAEEPMAERLWDIYFRASNGGGWQAVLDPNGQVGTLTVGDVETTVRRTRAATVRLVRRTSAPVLKRVEWRDPATLLLWLDYAGNSTVEAVTLNARQHDECLPFPVTTADGLLHAELPVGMLPRAGTSKPVRAGTWDIAARTTAGDVTVNIGTVVQSSLPATTSHHGRQYSVVDRRRNFLSLVVDGDLTHVERGRVNQTRLRTNDYPGLKTKINDTVLYESYYGKEFSDSPRSIFAELCRRDLDLDHLVVVRDQQFEVPDGATAIRHGSREYYEALAQSRYVVANTHLSNYFAKAPGQTVLQTWHGVGTKKIGLDMEGVNFANKSYIENILRGESDNWDYLVSPNPFTSPILRRAFAYRGNMLETGVPRNDIFYRPDRDAVAAQVRERLGIPPDRKIVMYGPTWRDNAFRGKGRYRLDLRIDLYEAARKLADEYAIVFRKHSNVVDRLPPGNGMVIDASDYPEVQELLLVTDVLISDYSTLMCDFANTGRPMLFYTYDLANYRDVLRGFYFDFENEVPGPLITEEIDLVPAILDADRIRLEYDVKYRNFAERFCPWDDGHAAERVVDAVFEQA